jgi:hypothetical protein
MKAMEVGREIMLEDGKRSSPEIQALSRSPNDVKIDLWVGAISLPYRPQIFCIFDESQPK